MTDKWTGRKYRGNLSGHVYEVLSEPFDWNGRQYVAYGAPGGSGQPGYEFTRNFEKDPYTRVIEPKYAAGDNVTNGQDVYVIDAVASKPDSEGDFPYLAIDSDGFCVNLWESLIAGKVSE